MPKDIKNQRRANNNQKDHRQRNEEKWKVEPKKIKNWITNKFDQETIEYTKRFGNHLKKKGLTRSQIRNLFNEVKRLQGSLRRNKKVGIYKDFLMLRPKMAYVAQRVGYGEKGVAALKDVLEEAHIAVFDGEELIEKRFDNFVDFFEAIIAYHKAAGGRDK